MGVKEASRSGRSRIRVAENSGTEVIFVEDLPEEAGDGGPDWREVYTERLRQAGQDHLARGEGWITGELLVKKARLDAHPCFVIIQG